MKRDLSPLQALPKLLAAVALAVLAWVLSAQSARAEDALEPRQSCAALLSADVSAAVGAPTRITAAVAAPAAAPDFCVLSGEIDQRIGFEVRLPLKHWSRRYLQTGCGGLCGVLGVHLDHAEGCTPIHDHTAVIAATDMGHRGSFMGDGRFGADPQARIDFAYRGVHLTALAGKALAAAFFGAAPRYAYFSGCSDGGREALMEAQRFPEDFDGIAAGAPAMNFQVQNSFYHGWQARTNVDADGHAILTADKLPALHAAVLAACDGLDGLVDGQIDDPRRCRFDPAVIACAAGAAETPECLTSAQVSVVRELFQGAHDAAGHRFIAGGPQPGSELFWRGVSVPFEASAPVPSGGMAMGTLANLSFPVNPPPTYALKDFHFDQQTFAALRPLHALYDATNPAIDTFAARRGKLILWHGWSDPHISPINTIAYLHALESHFGKAQTRGFARLFLFPGMDHCNGGDGPSRFDILTPLMRWVEAGEAPEVIIAGRPAPQPGRDSGPPSGPGAGPPPAGPPPEPEANPVLLRTRPVFPYPAVARYQGHGSTDQAANFLPFTPPDEPPLPTWEGADLMLPARVVDCAVADHTVVCK